MIITLIAVLHIKFASDVFNHVLHSSKYMFLEFLSHYNTIVTL
jgi:hypothetical protein